MQFRLLSQKAKNPLKTASGFILYSPRYFAVLPSAIESLDLDLEVKTQRTEGFYVRNLVEVVEKKRLFIVDFCSVGESLSLLFNNLYPFIPATNALSAIINRGKAEINPGDPIAILCPYLKELA